MKMSYHEFLNEWQTSAGYDELHAELVKRGQVLPQVGTEVDDLLSRVCFSDGGVEVIDLELAANMSDLVWMYYNYFKVNGVWMEAA